MKSAAAEAARTFAANRAVGRIALAVKASGGATRRWRVREEGSLRVRCPGPPAGELEAVIVNTAGGVAGGDRFSLDVAVEPGARLVVTTAAAEKVYRTLEPGRGDRREACGRRRRLAGLAAAGDDPVRPGAAQAHHRGRSRRGRAALLAEALVFGRSGMGEAVDDGRLFDRWRLRRNGRLIHAEAMRLDGGIASQARGARGRQRAGSRLRPCWSCPETTPPPPRVRALDAGFRGEVGSSAWNGFAVVRLCAADGAALRHDLVAVLGALRGAALPRLWLN